MCSYCGNHLNGEALEMEYENNVIRLCDEECAIYFFQEQQQTHFQSWISIPRKNILQSTM